MFAAVVCALLVMPVVAGAMNFAARLLGWALRMVLSIALLPLWVLLWVVCGLAYATRLLLPFALVCLVVSLFVPER